MRFKRGSLYGYLYGFTIPNPTIFRLFDFDSDFLSLRLFLYFDYTKYPDLDCTITTHAHQKMTNANIGV